MSIPIEINFDYEVGATYPSTGTAHLPKVYQGAPYSAYIRVKDSDGTYRDFTGYQIRMKARLNNQTGKALFFIGDGQIVGESDRISINFDGSVTELVKIPANSEINLIELEFVHDIELLTNDVVVARFAQGTGYLVLNSTR